MKLEVSLIQRKNLDVVCWNGRKNSRFVLRDVYEELRGKFNKVDWEPLVWFHKCIPRASFILWLAMLNRLPTRDQLHAWGVADSSACGLWGLARETRDHLFMYCHTPCSV